MAAPSAQTLQRLADDTGKHRDFRRRHTATTNRARLEDVAPSRQVASRPTSKPGSPFRAESGREPSR